jgi:hypothetical protein
VEQPSPQAEVFPSSSRARSCFHTLLPVRPVARLTLIGSSTRFAWP